MPISWRVQTPPGPATSDIDELKDDNDEYNKGGDEGDDGDREGDENEEDESDEDDSGSEIYEEEVVGSKAANYKVHHFLTGVSVLLQA